MSQTPRFNQQRFIESPPFVVIIKLYNYTNYAVNSDVLAVLRLRLSWTRIVNVRLRQNLTQESISNSTRSSARFTIQLKNTINKVTHRLSRRYRRRCCLVNVVALASSSLVSSPRSLSTHSEQSLAWIQISLKNTPNYKLADTN